MSQNTIKCFYTDWSPGSVIITKEQNLAKNVRQLKIDPQREGGKYPLLLLRKAYTERITNCLQTEDVTRLCLVCLRLFVNTGRRLDQKLRAMREQFYMLMMVIIWYEHWCNMYITLREFVTNSEWLRELLLHPKIMKNVTF